MDTESILKALVIDKSRVKYHKNWDSYYIETDLEAVRMIGLVEKDNELILSLYYGDTQRQSRSFYTNIINKGLLGYGWDVYPNFHLENKFGANVFYFGSPSSPDEYISFWQNNRHLLIQRPLSQLVELLDDLAKSQIIDYNPFGKEETLSKIKSSGYNTFSICAGLGVVFPISYNSIQVMRESGDLDIFLISKINEGLGIIGENGDSFLMNLDTQESQPAEMGDPPPTTW